MRRAIVVVACAGLFLLGGCANGRGGPSAASLSEKANLAPDDVMARQCFRFWCGGEDQVRMLLKEKEGHAEKWLIRCCIYRAMEHQFQYQPSFTGGYCLEYLQSVKKASVPEILNMAEGSKGAWATGILRLLAHVMFPRTVTPVTNQHPTLRPDGGGGWVQLTRTAGDPLRTFVSWKWRAESEAHVVPAYIPESTAPEQWFTEAIVQWKEVARAEGLCGE